MKDKGRRMKTFRFILHPSAFGKRRQSETRIPSLVCDFAPGSRERDYFRLRVSRDFRQNVYLVAWSRSQIVMWSDGRMVVDCSTIRPHDCATTRLRDLQD
jgi:hypothetical protein